MTVHFDPILPGPIIAALILLLAVLAAGLYRRYRDVVTRSYWRWLNAARVLAFLAVLLLLMNPFDVRTAPDTSKYKVIVVVDGTSSMDTVDCDGRSRLQIVREQIVDRSAAFAAMVGHVAAEPLYLLFSGSDPRRFDPAAPFNSLPGQTDIDGVLTNVLTGDTEPAAIGAVILVSDGGDNVGASAMEAARPYRDAGIPIHCIGVGDPKPRRDVDARWSRLPEYAVEGQPLALTAKLQRNFDAPQSVTIALSINGRLLESRDVHFDESRRDMEVQFVHAPVSGGMKTFKLHATSVAGEDNALNNTDYAVLDIHEPETFSVLYFSANLDWQYKFLQRIAEEQDTLTLDAVIRLGRENLFVHGASVSGADAGGLPDCAALNEYDGIILALDSLYLLESGQLECLVGFIENRGGGVLFTGLPGDIPEQIQPLLPVASLPTDFRRLREQPVVLHPGKILAVQDEMEWTRLQNGLYVPAESEVINLTPDMIKPGAATILSAEQTRTPLFVTHQFAAGKVGFLNIGTTWKWVMQRDSGRDLYGRFWEKAISWMVSSTKERLAVSPSSTRLRVLEEREFVVDLLDAQFVPDNGGRISCAVRGPGEFTAALHFIADGRTDGRYRAMFVPRVVGDYRFDFTAVTAAGESLALSNEYLVTDLSPESAPRPLEEGVLQSLAWQTGGTYWNYRSLDRNQSITVARHVEETEIRRSWLQSWWFLGLILMLVLPDWILRRRIGLK